MKVVGTRCQCLYSPKQKVHIYSPDNDSPAESRSAAATSSAAVTSSSLKAGTSGSESVGGIQALWGEKGLLQDAWDEKVLL